MVLRGSNLSWPLGKASTLPSVLSLWSQKLDFEMFCEGTVLENQHQLLLSRSLIEASEENPVQNNTIINAILYARQCPFPAHLGSQMGSPLGVHIFLVAPEVAC